MRTIPRIVVTGKKDNQSYIAEDYLATNINTDKLPFIITDIWQTSQMPASLERENAIENTLYPSVIKQGTYFRYVHIPPDQEMGIHYTPQSALPHPLMHSTPSLDYIIILAGEIYLVTETEETLLKAGDIVIQRATNHAWSNRSTEPCIQIAILIDANNGE